MTTTEPLPTQAFLDGAQDMYQPARYQLIGELLKDCASVLDVGCGDGILTGFLNGQAYVGLDADTVAIDRAIRHVQVDGKFNCGPIEFICTDAATWTTQRHFDAVILNEVLYYLKDPLTALRKWVAIVNPGGLLIVSIYNRPSQFWQSNPNMKALKIARRFAGRNLEQEIPVEQNGKKWSVLVIHC